MNDLVRFGATDLASSANPVWRTQFDEFIWHAADLAYIHTLPRDPLKYYVLRTS